ncbi:MAG: hypothetical protein NZM26_01745, partial [Patescibacteria group bacterium]|nr:hypothetical protein [Patescibacteria group bacterium]
VMVAGGNNHLSSNPCGCVNGETTVTVKNNGADSTNKVKVKSKNTSQQGQHGETNSSTSVYSKAQTGKNKIKKATGGNSEVKTGDSESAVSVIVTGGHNYL